MHRPMLALVLAFAALAAIPSAAQAQQTNTNFAALGSDPFATYYGWYLPNQAYQASQSRVQDTINAITVMRQQSAIAQRDQLFDTPSRFDLDEEGTFGRAPRGGGAGGAMRSRPGVGGAQMTNPFAENVRGTGPALYFSRTDRYFPTIRPGRGPNRNVAVLRSARGANMGGMGGNVGGGMPSMPGPR